MNWKKLLAMVSCFIIVWSFLTASPEADAASAQKSMDSIVLKESPYSLGEGWTVDSSYNSNPPYSLVKGNKEYVAVGPYGTVMKSTDGRNWKALSKFGNYQLTTIAWNGTKYLMFGANAESARQANVMSSEAFVSTDALKWKKIKFKPGEAIHDLVWSGNKFVAVGRENVFTSSDGENWTKTHKFGVTYGSHSIRYIHDTYFIYSDVEQKVYTSKDGVKWTSKPLDTKADINEMIWVKDHYLGVGKGIYTSKDGLTWSKQNKSPNKVILQSLVTDGKTYIAVGSNQQNGSSQQVSYTSNDGVNWKQHNLSNFHTAIYTMYPVNGGFSGIGSNSGEMDPDGTYSIYTSDGVQWSFGLVGTNTSGGGEFGGIATNGKRTVAVGLYGSIIYTDNGTKWKSSNPFSYGKSSVRPFLFDVAWGANKFVAVGHNGAYVSSDGASWKKASMPSNERYTDLSNILWTGKFFVASDQVSGVFTSKDGVSWKKVKSVSDDWLMSMIWDGKRVLATFQVYNGGKQYTKIMQTTDGTNWVQLAKLDAIVADVAWNGKSYVAVYPYDATKMWVSTDGKKWTKATVNLDQNDAFQFITSFDGYFFAFNESITDINGEYYYTYYVSKDGLKWREVPIPKKYSDFGYSTMRDGVKAYGKYIFVGAYGQIMYTSKLQL